MSKPYSAALLERFLRYVKIDTQSDEKSTKVPSTGRQLDLSLRLLEELHEMGATEIELTDYACVLATIPATVDNAPTIGFLAHVDTSPDVSGSDVKPIVHRNYDGSPIVLPDDPTKVLNQSTTPTLQQRTGTDIVTASGTTLLGADDKAGVAILMTLAAELLATPAIPHGRIRLCFTPDEEIGRGVLNLDLDHFGADVAYTLDGGLAGVMVAETWSADKAVVIFDGVSAHPGQAKDIMVNAVKLAAEFVGLLPTDERTPETTADRDGFVHAHKIHGNSTQATVELLLRDYELDGLAAHAAIIEAACEQVRAAEPRASVTCTITPQYRNMRYWLDADPRPVAKAHAAYRAHGLTIVDRASRGGTDGSVLTERGLPTPNLFTGMQAIHSPLEWVSMYDMEMAVAVCTTLVEQWAADDERVE